MKSLCAILKVTILLMVLCGLGRAQQVGQGPALNPSSTPFGIAQSSSRRAPIRVPPYLGIEMEDGKGWGVLVKRVVPGSAAGSAGVEAGDRVLGMGTQVTETIRDLRLVLGKFAAGDRVRLIVRREQELQVVEVVLGARPSATPAAEPLTFGHEDTIRFINLQPGQVVADIGCGTGWLSTRLAELTGPTGKVFGLEIDKARMVELKQHSFANLTWVHSEPDDLTLGEDLLDVAVLRDVASHVSQWARVKFYASLARSLKETGTLIVFGPHGNAESMLADLAWYGFVPENADELSQMSARELDRRLRLGIRFRCRAK